MNFDVVEHLRAVQRSVSSSESDGRSFRAVTLARGYTTTVNNLWDAVSSGKRIPCWLSPISGNLELGGRYQLEGNAGGVITACSPPLHFSVTWEFGEDVSWVELHLSSDGTGRARLSLTHTAVDSDHWTKYGPGAAGVGWDLGLFGLAMHLSHPAALKPDEAAFVSLPDGKAFIAGSSEKWEQAAIAFGTDAAAAHAAAMRTTAFYTGELSELD